MRPLSRALLATAVAALAVPLWTVPAQAASGSGSETAAYGAYFSVAGIRKPDESPAAPPNLTANADGVSPDNLAVAGSGGQDTKISFLFFQLADVPLDATFTKATVTVPLVPNSPQDTTYNAAPAKVRACPSGPEGFFGEDGAAVQDAPARLCPTAQIAGKPSADGKAYVFEITDIAQLWVAANDGLALLPNDGANTAPFQVVFRPATEATIEYAFTAPDPDPSAGGGAGGSTGGGTVDLPVTDTTSLDGGFSGDTGTGTSDFGSIDTGTTPPLVGTAPEATTPEPQTAGDSTVATQRTAADLPVEVLSPTAGFWLAALLLAGGLVFLGLVMGDNRSPALAAGSGRPSRLSQTLADRSRAGSLLASSRPTS